MKSSRFFAYLQLMRPANLVTAMADILAGVCMASFSIGHLHRSFLTWIPLPGQIPSESFLWHYTFILVASTIGLYGGGVVFNDVFDAKLDAIERPERPIPNGRASLKGATILGASLLAVGIVMAFFVSSLSGTIALFIAFFALLYDKIGKHQSWGPLNMGLCRGLNLFLGMSIPMIQGATVFPPLEVLNSRWYAISSYLSPFHLLLIPILYIAAITSISRGEVHGGSKKGFLVPFLLYILVVALLLSQYSLIVYWERLPFLGFFLWLIFPPLLRAYKDTQPRNIGLAVKAGVIALIAMDATLAATFSGWEYGLLVLALLPVSRLLARFFAVT